MIENYGVQRPGTENTHKLDVRTDYSLGAADRVMARYSFLQQDIYREAIFEGLGDGVGNQGEQFNRNQSLGLSWTRIIGTRMVNEARVGYNRTHSRFAHATANDQTASAFGFVGLPDFIELDGRSAADRAEQLQPARHAQLPAPVSEPPALVRVLSRPSP